MPADRDNVRRLVQKSAINPRTGDFWRLTDSEVKPGIDSLKARLEDPSKALKFLKQNGFLTPTGKLPKKYGG